MIRKIFIIFIAIALPIMLCFLYFHYKEADSAWSVQCSFYQWTGFLCPGCGGQRAFHHLLHGELSQALRSNALFVLALPFFAYLYYTIIQIYGLKNTKYSKKLLFPNFIGKAVLWVLLLFFIMRNIPVFPFTLLCP